MKGAIGIAQYVATEVKLNRLLALQREQTKRDRELLQVEQATERVLRDEEMTRASLARRIQLRAEAEEALQRMHRNPGVSFLGYESPARRKLSDMRSAIREHESAAQIARERLSLVVSSSQRARQNLRSTQARHHAWLHENALAKTPLQLEATIYTAREDLRALVSSLQEVEIDEAVMRNQVKISDAARVRQALRRRPTCDLER